MSEVNTVLGPISTDQLGFTLMHEHVMVSASVQPASVANFSSLTESPMTAARAFHSSSSKQAMATQRSSIGRPPFVSGAHLKALCGEAKGRWLPARFCSTPFAV